MASAAARRPAGPTRRLTTLKRRAEFLRVRKGARWATPAFVLEAKARVETDAEARPGAAARQPRFGFTVTRQVGKAVERNRIRRRLKAAVRDVMLDHARCGFDYVLIAREPALTSGYDALVANLVEALERVHRAPAREAVRPGRR
jgi:ribonuclease P protein component